MNSRGYGLIYTMIASLAVAVCLSGTPAFSQDQQQEPSDQSSATVQQQSGDRAPATAEQGSVPTSQHEVPSALTLPEGTVISARAIQRLSTENNQVGDRFSAANSRVLQDYRI